MAKYDVAVVGAGAFGAWTAWHLVRAGRRVLLMDSWGPGHSRASSGGESRIIRMGYGADPIYTGMAARSLPFWRELESRSGETVFVPSGVLWVSREGNEYGLATRKCLSEAAVPHTLLLSTELSRRFPQFQFPGTDVYGILEPHSGALMARQAVHAVVRDALALGADYRLDAVQVSSSGDVRSISGPNIDAAAFVFACGPWLPKLFPGLLGDRIHPTRQEVFFFAPPAGDRRFGPDIFPAWIDFSDPRGPYGFPDLEHRGVKLAFDRHGEDFDPDFGSRSVTAGAVEVARHFLRERIPALASAPLTETRVCQYENTCSGDFLLDRHPDFENIWLAGGGSGHGFKHGPAVGEYLAGRILHNTPEESRFSLATKLSVRQRTVY